MRRGVVCARGALGAPLLVGLLLLVAVGVQNAAARHVARDKLSQALASLDLEDELPANTTAANLEAEGPDCPDTEPVVKEHKDELLDLTTENDATISALTVLPVLPATRENAPFWDDDSNNLVYAPSTKRECAKPETCPLVLYPSYLEESRVYEVVVSAPITSVFVIAKPACNRAIVTLAGRRIEANTPVKTPTLQTTTNTFDLVVTAADRQTVMTYRLLVMRELGADLTPIPRDERAYSLEGIDIEGCWFSAKVAGKDKPVYDPEDGVWHYNADWRMRDFMRQSKTSIITRDVLSDHSSLLLSATLTPEAVAAGVTTTLALFENSGGVNKRVRSRSECSKSAAPCFAMTWDQNGREMATTVHLPLRQATVVLHIVVTAADRHMKKTYAVDIARGLDGAVPKYDMQQPDCGHLNDCNRRGKCILRFPEQDAAAAADPGAEFVLPEPVSECDCLEGYVFDDCSSFIGSRSYLHLVGENGELTHPDDMQREVHDKPYYADASERYPLAVEGRTASRAEDLGLDVCADSLSNNPGGAGLPATCVWAREECERLHREVLGELSITAHVLRQRCDTLIGTCFELATVEVPKAPEPIPKHILAHIAVPARQNATGTETKLDQGIFENCYFRTALPPEEGAALLAVDVCPGKVEAYQKLFKEVHATVASEVYKVTVRLRASPHSVVTVKGKPVPAPLGDEMLEADPLIVLHGPNRIPITVTAEDFMTTTTYTLVVTREYPKLEYVVEGSSVRLRFLECWAGLQPAFSPSMHNYATNEVAHGVSNTVVKAIPEDELAYVTVDGSAVRAGMLSDPIALLPGTTQITVVVTAPDGVRAGTYTITARRALGEKGVSDLAMLEGLEISEDQVLKPEFDPEHTEYAVSVPENVNSIFVRAKAMHEDGEALPTIAIRGSVEPSGARSRRLDLLHGPNVVDVVVTASDQSTTRTYAVVVTRRYARPVPGASNVAKLVTLVPANDLKLEPEFSPDHLEYTLSVPNPVDHTLTFRVAALDNAFVQVNGDAVKSGGRTRPILLPGHKSLKHDNGKPVEVKFRVISPSLQASATYTVLVGEGSSNAGLQRLVPSVGALLPPFEPDRLTYSLMLRVKGQTSVRFRANVKDPGASVKVQEEPCEDGEFSQEVPLSPDNKPTFVRIRTTSPNGLQSLTYTVTVLHTVGPTIGQYADYSAYGDHGDIPQDADVIEYCRLDSCYEQIADAPSDSGLPPGCNTALGMSLARPEYMSASDLAHYQCPHTAMCHSLEDCSVLLSECRDRIVALERPLSSALDEWHSYLRKQFTALSNSPLSITDLFPNATLTDKDDLFPKHNFLHLAIALAYDRIPARAGFVHATDMYHLRHVITVYRHLAGEVHPKELRPSVQSEEGIECNELEGALQTVLGYPAPFAHSVISKLDCTQPVTFDTFLGLVASGVVHTTYMRAVQQSRETGYLRFLLASYDHMQTEATVQMDRSRAEMRIATYLKEGHTFTTHPKSGTWPSKWGSAVSRAVAGEDTTITFGEWAVGAKNGMLMLDPLYHVPLTVSTELKDETGAQQDLQQSVEAFGKVFKHSMLFSHIRLWESFDPGLSPDELGEALRDRFQREVGVPPDPEDDSGGQQPLGTLQFADFLLGVVRGMEGSTAEEAEDKLFDQYVRAAVLGVVPAPGRAHEWRILYGLYHFWASVPCSTPDRTDTPHQTCQRAPVISVAEALKLRGIGPRDAEFIALASSEVIESRGRYATFVRFVRATQNGLLSSVGSLGAYSDGQYLTLKAIELQQEWRTLDQDGKDSELTLNEIVLGLRHNGFPHRLADFVANNAFPPHCDTSKEIEMGGKCGVLRAVAAGRLPWQDVSAWMGGVPSTEDVAELGTNKYSSQRLLGVSASLWSAPDSLLDSYPRETRTPIELLQTLQDLVENDPTGLDLITPDLFTTDLNECGASDGKLCAPELAPLTVKTVVDTVADHPSRPRELFASNGRHLFHVLMRALFSGFASNNVGDVLGSSRMAWFRVNALVTDFRQLFLTESNAKHSSYQAFVHSALADSLVVDLDEAAAENVRELFGGFLWHYLERAKDAFDGQFFADSEEGAQRFFLDLSEFQFLYERGLVAPLAATDPLSPNAFHSSHFAFALRQRLIEMRILFDTIDRDHNEVVVEDELRAFLQYSGCSVEEIGLVVQEAFAQDATKAPHRGEGVEGLALYAFMSLVVDGTLPMETREGSSLGEVLAAARDIFEGEAAVSHEGETGFGGLRATITEASVDHTTVRDAVEMQGFTGSDAVLIACSLTKKCDAAGQFVDPSDQPPQQAANATNGAAQDVDDANNDGVHLVDFVLAAQDGWLPLVPLHGEAPSKSSKHRGSRERDQTAFFIASGNPVQVVVGGGDTGKEERRVQLPHLRSHGDLEAAVQAEDPESSKLGFTILAAMPWDTRIKDNFLSLAQFSRLSKHHVFPLRGGRGTSNAATLHSTVSAYAPHWLANGPSSSSMEPMEAYLRVLLRMACDVEEWRNPLLSSAEILSLCFKHLSADDQHRAAQWPAHLFKNTGWGDYPRAFELSLLPLDQQDARRVMAMGIMFVKLLGDQEKLLLGSLERRLKKASGLSDEDARDLIRIASVGPTLDSDRFMDFDGFASAFLHGLLPLSDDNTDAAANIETLMALFKRWTEGGEELSMETLKTKLTDELHYPSHFAALMAEAACTDPRQATNRRNSAITFGQFLRAISAKFLSVRPYYGKLTQDEVADMALPELLAQLERRGIPRSKLEVDARQEFAQMHPNTLRKALEPFAVATDAEKTSGKFTRQELENMNTKALLKAASRTPELSNTALAKRIRQVLMEETPITKLLNSFAADGKDWVQQMRTILTNAVVRQQGGDGDGDGEGKGEVNEAAKARTQAAMSGLISSFQVHGSVMFLLRAIEARELGAKGDEGDTDSDGTKIGEAAVTLLVLEDDAWRVYRAMDESSEKSVQGLVKVDHAQRYLAQHGLPHYAKHIALAMDMFGAGAIDFLGFHRCYEAGLVPTTDQEGERLERELDRLMEEFRTLDTSGDGKVSKSEFVAGHSGLRHLEGVTDRDIQSIGDSLGVVGYDSIEFGSYALAIKEKMTHSTSDQRLAQELLSRVRTVFASYNPSTPLTMTKDQLLRGLASLGYNSQASAAVHATVVNMDVDTGEIRDPVVHFHRFARAYLDGVVPKEPLSSLHHVPAGKTAESVRGRLGKEELRDCYFDRLHAQSANPAPEEKFYEVVHFSRDGDDEKARYDEAVFQAFRGEGVPVPLVRQDICGLRPGDESITVLEGESLDRTFQVDGARTFHWVFTPLHGGDARGDWAQDNTALQTNATGKPMTWLFRSKLPLFNTNRLAFASLMPDDSGTYQCVAETSYSRISRQVASCALKVRVKSKAEQAAENTRVLAKDKVLRGIPGKKQVPLHVSKFTLGEVSGSPSLLLFFSGEFLDSHLLDLTKIPAYLSFTASEAADPERACDHNDGASIERSGGHGVMCLGKYGSPEILEGPKDAKVGMLRYPLQSEDLEKLDELLHKEGKGPDYWLFLHVREGAVASPAHGPLKPSSGPLRYEDGVRLVSWGLEVSAYQSVVAFRFNGGIPRTATNPQHFGAISVRADSSKTAVAVGNSAVTPNSVTSIRVGDWQSQAYVGSDPTTVVLVLASGTASKLRKIAAGMTTTSIAAEPECTARVTLPFGTVVGMGPLQDTGMQSDEPLPEALSFPQPIVLPYALPVYDSVLTPSVCVFGETAQGTSCEVHSAGHNCELDALTRCARECACAGRAGSCGNCGRCAFNANSTRGGEVCRIHPCDTNFHRDCAFFEDDTPCVSPSISGEFLCAGSRCEDRTCATESAACPNNPHIARLGEYFTKRGYLASPTARGKCSADGLCERAVYRRKKSAGGAMPYSNKLWCQQFGPESRINSNALDITSQRQAALDYNSLKALVGDSRALVSFDKLSHVDTGGEGSVDLTSLEDELQAFKATYSEASTQLQQALASTGSLSFFVYVNVPADSLIDVSMFTRLGVKTSEALARMVAQSSSHDFSLSSLYLDSIAAPEHLKVSRLMSASRSLPESQLVSSEYDSLHELADDPANTLCVSLTWEGVPETRIRPLAQLLFKMMRGTALLEVFQSTLCAHLGVSAGDCKIDVRRDVEFLGVEDIHDDEFEYACPYIQGVHDELGKRIASAARLTSPDLSAYYAHTTKEEAVVEEDTPLAPSLPTSPSEQRPTSVEAAGPRSVMLQISPEAPCKLHTTCVATVSLDNPSPFASASLTLPVRLKAQNCKIQQVAPVAKMTGSLPPQGKLEGGASARVEFMIVEASSDERVPCRVHAEAKRVKAPLPATVVPSSAAIFNIVRPKVVTPSLLFCRGSCEDESGERMETDTYVQAAAETTLWITMPQRGDTVELGCQGDDAELTKAECIARHLTVWWYPSEGLQGEKLLIKQDGGPWPKHAAPEGSVGTHEHMVILHRPSLVGEEQNGDVTVSVRFELLTAGEYVFWVEPGALASPVSQQSNKASFVFAISMFGGAKQLTGAAVTEHAKFAQSGFVVELLSTKDYRNTEVRDPAQFSKGQYTQCAAFHTCEHEEPDRCRGAGDDAAAKVEKFVKGLHAADFWNLVSGDKVYVETVQGSPVVVFDCLKKGEYRIYCSSLPYLGLQPGKDYVDTPMAPILEIEYATDASAPPVGARKEPMRFAYDLIHSELQRAAFLDDYSAKCKAKSKADLTGRVSLAQFYQGMSKLGYTAAQQTPYGYVTVGLNRTAYTSKHAWETEVLPDLLNHKALHKVSLSEPLPAGDHNIGFVFRAIARTAAFVTSQRLATFLGVREEDISEFILLCQTSMSRSTVRRFSTANDPLYKLNTCSELIHAGPEMHSTVSNPTWFNSNKDTLDALLARWNCPALFKFEYLTVDSLSADHVSPNPIRFRVGGVRSSRFHADDVKEVGVWCVAVPKAKDDLEYADLLESKTFHKYPQFYRKLTRGNQDVVEGSIFVLPEGDESETKTYTLMCAVRTYWYTVRSDFDYHLISSLTNIIDTAQQFKMNPNTDLFEPMDVEPQVGGVVCQDANAVAVRVKGSGCTAVTTQGAASAITRPLSGEFDVVVVAPPKEAGEAMGVKLQCGSAPTVSCGGVMAPRFREGDLAQRCTPASSKCPVVGGVDRHDGVCESSGPRVLVVPGCDALQPPRLPVSLRSASMIVTERRGNITNFMRAFEEQSDVLGWINENGY